MWHSLAAIRAAIQQTNAIISSACGCDERPCQVAVQKGQIELGVSDGIVMRVQPQSLLESKRATKTH